MQAPESAAALVNKVMIRTFLGPDRFAAFITSDVRGV
jgi:hypothetical protein